MKKLLICSMFFIATLTYSFAQQKGDKYVGGSLHLATSTLILDGGSATTVDLGLSPEFGYFVADKLKLGLQAGYFLSYNETVTHTVAIGPSLAYYVRLSDNFYYTPEIFIGFEYAGSKYLDGYGLGLSLSIVGFEFKPKPNIGISFNVLGIGYEFFSFPDLDMNGSGLSFQLGLKSSIGFKYYF